MCRTSHILSSSLSASSGSALPTHSWFKVLLLRTHGVPDCGRRPTAGTTAEAFCKVSFRDAQQCSQWQTEVLGTLICHILELNPLPSCGLLLSACHMDSMRKHRNVTPVSLFVVISTALGQYNQSLYSLS
jgi:hypothetical protein